MTSTKNTNSSPTDAFYAEDLTQLEAFLARGELNFLKTTNDTQSSLIKGLVSQNKYEAFRFLLKILKEEYTPPTINEDGLSASLDSYLLLNNEHKFYTILHELGLAQSFPSVKAELEKVSIAYPEDKLAMLVDIVELVHYTSETEAHAEANLQIDQPKSLPHLVGPLADFPTLSLATRSGNTTLVDTLIAHKHPIDATDRFGSTPLMHAAENLNYASIKTLLSHGASPHHKNKIGASVLSILVKKHAKFLMNKTNNADKENNPEKDVLAHADGEFLEILESLYDASIDFNEKLPSGDRIWGEFFDYAPLSALGAENPLWGFLLKAVRAGRLDLDLESDDAPVPSLTIKEHYLRLQAQGNTQLETLEELLSHASHPGLKVIGMNSEEVLSLIESQKAENPQKAVVVLPKVEGFFNSDIISVMKKLTDEDPDITFYSLTDAEINVDLYKVVNGIVLPGLYDNFPKDKEFTLKDLDPSTMLPSEKLYQKIIESAKEAHVPLVGLCAGAQHMSLYHNATLMPVKGYVLGEHSATIKPISLGSLMFMTAAEQKNALENCAPISISIPKIATAHHYAMKADTTTHDIFSVQGFSEEGVVEMVGDNRLMIGTQFHPEDSQHDPRQKLFFLNFLKMAKTHARLVDIGHKLNMTAQESGQLLGEQNHKFVERLEHCIFHQETPEMTLSHSNETMSMSGDSLFDSISMTPPPMGAQTVFISFDTLA